MNILLLDIESTPNLSWVWDHYETTVIKHVEEWSILCVAHMWLKDKFPKVCSRDEVGSERNMLELVWELLDTADVVVAHNGDKFDVKKLNARFIQYGLGPPSPFFTVDTLKVARQYFRFNQNGLDPLAQHLGLGKKVKHQGFELWEACMNDEPRAWTKMKRYAKQDVILLKQLYLRFLPWIQNHPNVMVKNGGIGCPNCGSPKMQKRGVRHTRTMTYQQYLCRGCGKWSRARLAEKVERPEMV